MEGIATVAPSAGVSIWGTDVESKLLAASVPRFSAALASGARWRSSSNEIGFGSGATMGGSSIRGKSTTGMFAEITFATGWTGAAASAPSEA